MTQSVNIRGVGLASGNASASNGVATYIDGMFQPAVVTTNSFFDIASVEVFRGPPGHFRGLELDRRRAVHQQPQS